MVFSLVLVVDSDLVFFSFSNCFLKWLAIICACFFSFAVYRFLCLILSWGTFGSILFIYFIVLNIWVKSSFDFSISSVCLSSLFVFSCITRLWISVKILFRSWQSTSLPFLPNDRSRWSLIVFWCSDNNVISLFVGCHLFVFKLRIVSGALVVKSIRFDHYANTTDWYGMVSRKV